MNLCMLITSIKLGNALSQNCGAKMHKELASRSFTDAVLRLANDRVCSDKRHADNLANS